MFNWNHLDLKKLVYFKNAFQCFYNLKRGIWLQDSFPKQCGLFNLDQTLLDTRNSYFFSFEEDKKKQTNKQTNKHEFATFCILPEDKNRSCILMQQPYSGDELDFSNLYTSKTVIL